MSDIDRESVEWALSTTRELIAAGRPAPTPRTNEEVFDTLGEGQYGDKVVWADFARQLERKLSAERQKYADLTLAYERTNAELSAAKAEAERLREALQLAVRQNSHDMILTDEELRRCEAALAATRKEEWNG